MQDIYDPIISIQELSRRQVFEKIPVPEADTALVFVGDGQAPLTVIAGQKGLTRGEMLWGRYHQVYKVDMSDFLIGFSCNLPCATDAFDFPAQVQFTCSVRDPQMIVSRKVTDIRQVLEPLIKEKMRRVSRKYEVEQSGDAEREISDSVKTTIYDEGFNLKKFTVTISLEKEARERIREKKRLQEEIELEKARQALQQQKAQQAIEEARQREKLELERLKQRQELELELEQQKAQKAIEEAKQREKLELDHLKQRQEFELEQEKIRLEQSINIQRIQQILETEKGQFARQEEKAQLLDAMEIQMMQQNFEKTKMQFELEQAQKREQFELQMMKQKTEFYAGMLQAGQWQLLALQLAQSPKDVQVILQTLNQQKQIEREHQVKMLKMLLDSDAVEGYQLSEVGKRALQELIGLSEQPTAALESAPTKNTESKENIPTADEVFPDEE